MGRRRRGVGRGLRRGVRAERRGELYGRRAEDEEDSGGRRGGCPRRIHRQGSRENGAVHRQHQLPEKKGGRLQILRPQAIDVVAVTRVPLPPTASACFDFGRLG